METFDILNLDYLIYQNSEFENTPWGYKDIETKKSKFGAKTQFLCGRHILAVFLVPAKHWFIILNILKGNLTAFSEKCFFCSNTIVCISGLLGLGRLNFQNRRDLTLKLLN